MKLPLRPLAIITSGLLCLSACCSASASNPGQGPSPVAVDVGSGGAAPAELPENVLIPGPLRSFLRMAGISQEISPDQVLPLLARNVYLRGYQDGAQTEFLILLNRYVQYARELQALAGSNYTIHVSGCDDAAQLIHILGYEFQQPCGQNGAYLRATNAERAFLTLDSGFPLTGLEDALREHTSFSYPFPATQVPVLFSDKDWVGASYWRKKGGTDVLDVLLHDVNVDRLYWALSKNDEETRDALRRSPGLKTLIPLAPALEFYGSQICIRSGRVLVPGGPGAEHGWEDLVGASPGSPGSFVNHLLAKDQGWLAAYYDALSRVDREQQARLTEWPRLKRLYDVYRRAGSGSGFTATKGVYPKNADLLILFTRLQWQPNDKPYVPGNLGLWREILLQNSSPELIRGWTKHANSWDDPEQLLLTLVACSNFENDAGPLQTYLTLGAIDEARSPGARLSDQTVRLLAGNFGRFHTWYLIFSDFPTLNDASITQFVNVAQAVNGISSPALRANAMGAFQADIGLWKILARQQQIPNDKLNQSWQDAIQPFAAISSSTQLFDASRSSLKSLVVTVKGDANNLSQDQIIEMLAGPPQESEAGRKVHEQLVEKMQSVLDDQQLASLDTLFGLYDGLDQMAHGSKIGDQLTQLAGDLREFELPRPVFTSSEKIAWTGGIYSSRHAELQIRTDLTKVIKAPGSPAQLDAARGQLTPFLRDTLVGLNYAYYEPPGAQTLHHNPLLVRSHDFSGSSIQGYNAIWDSPELVGVGVTAGGGAYLIGSLADLSYALALTEEDFIAPENVQALIWRAEVPELLVSATQPRWWHVSASELHAAALYQRSGEELLIAAAGNTDLRGKVTEILSDVMSPRRMEMVQQALLHADGVAALIPQITPAEKFYLTVEFRKKFPAEAASWGTAGRELDDLVRKDSLETDPERLSRDFGVPHPTLAQTNGCGILGVKPFPAFAGDAYRLLGESWQSSNLYWARIADEMDYPPVMLNVVVPELTRHMVAKIFATDIEDWQALLLAMEQTGTDFREGRITLAKTSLVAER
jgi:hypothetical protein